MFTSIRCRTACTAAALTLAGSGLLVPAEAHATGLDLSCSGSQTATYKPPLTNTTQSTKVQITETYTSCLPNPAGIASGKGSFSITENASCTTINQPGSVTDVVTYEWNNDKKSTVTFTTVAVARLADGSTQVTATGQVTDGFGKGDKATRTVTLPELNATACSGAGVKNQTGPATLTFASA
ncbi:hypothetical protein [Streptomyces sp. CT34]|uniref:hypothetical protein n=1 Tax=Streptomyces sp. CT34 TaxID=1553907 RepID=UPI0005BE282F|nr:hypothetical protein [Streptomyces sp. CT34]